MSVCGPGLTQMAFDTTNPEAVGWAQRRSAELVRGITDESRVAIRNVITRSFIDGIPPKQSAKLIREIVGLTDGQAQAVVNARVKWLAKGLSQDVADGKVARYAEKLRRFRAMNIARTETMRASNEGQRQLWAQARERGFLDGSEKRVWIATDSERTCPQCSALDGTTTGLDGTFDGGIEGPPAHPMCRCSQGLVLERRKA